MGLPVNPYTAGDPVGKSPSFVGRQDVLREVLRVLRHPEQNAITLYGQRRIGKTSILQYLEEHLPEEGPYRPVYFDLMGYTGQPLGELLCHLADKIAGTLELPAPDLGSDPETAFQQVWLPAVLRALPAKAQLVLLMDEFDVQADPAADRAAKKRFFAYMRDLRHLDHRRLQFVFVLGRTLDDLDIIAQGLFKDLPARRVSLLNREDSEYLIRLSERQGSLAWEKGAVTRVWRLTSGHPYLTQALCSEVWEAAYEASDSPPAVRHYEVDAAVPATLERSAHMFAWLWEGLGPAEKVVAAALASAGPVVVDEERLAAILTESGVRILIRELRDAPQLLQKWDILLPVPEEGGYRFRVELLRRWIAENCPLERVQDELDRLNPVADNLYQAGRAFYTQGNLEDAANLLQQALKLNPSHLKALELLGVIYLAQDNLDAARETLEVLYDLAPARARARLKQVYLRQAERAAVRSEQLGWYERVQQISPDDPEVEAAIATLHAELEREEQIRSRFLEGKQALANGEWERAAEALRWVVDISPDYGDDTTLAVDLLAEAVRKGKSPPPRRWGLLRGPQMLVWLAYAGALLLLALTLGLGIRLVDLGVRGYGPMAFLATPTATFTASPTPAPTFTDTPAPTHTPTATPLPAAGSIWQRPQDGMRMVYIPAGTFRMGSEEGRPEERPVHPVTLDAFWMDQHEVTNAMYRQCVAAGVCEPPAEGATFDRDAFVLHPVVYVSWEAARAYCAWVGARLPTEAEWEYAARGGLDGKRYPWGNEEPTCTPGATNGARYAACGDTTAPVMTFAPNGYGLYDMAGNVWEWVADWYDEDYYAVSARENPKGPEKGAGRVIRGGSWRDDAPALRVTSRRSASRPVEYIGFRCARSP